MFKPKFNLKNSHEINISDFFLQCTYDFTIKKKHFILDFIECKSDYNSLTMKYLYNAGMACN